MSTRVHPGTVAGLLSLLAAILVGSIWYIYLFVARERAAPFEALGYAFSPSNEARWVFALRLLALRICSMLAGVEAGRYCSWQWSSLWASLLLLWSIGGWLCS